MTIQWHTPTQNSGEHPPDLTKALVTILQPFLDKFIPKKGSVPLIDSSIVKLMAWCVLLSVSNNAWANATSCRYSCKGVFDIMSVKGSYFSLLLGEFLNVSNESIGKKRTQQWSHCQLPATCSYRFALNWNNWSFIATFNRSLKSDLVIFNS